MTGATLATLVWPHDRLGEAVDVLARRLGGDPEQSELPVPPAWTATDQTSLDRWVRAVCGQRGLVAEPAETTWGDTETFVRAAAPALLRVGGDGQPGFLVIRRARNKRVELAGPDGRSRWVGTGALADVVRGDVPPEASKDVVRLIERAEVPASRRKRVGKALLAKRLEAERLSVGWLVEPDPGSSFWRQLRLERLPRWAGWMLGAHLLQYVFLILSWWVLGRGVLAGRLEPGWLAAWLGLLISMIPVAVWEDWLLARITTRGGAVLRRRLFAGSLRLQPDEIRHQGIGQFLGRVIDAEAFESFVLSGGRIGLIVLAELAVALPILAVGAGGWMHALLLPVWVALTLWVWNRYLRERQGWTGARLGMTHDLVEQMVGHRTRLAQEVPERWHHGEDVAVETYLELSRRMDRKAALLRTAIPRGWLLAALLVLAPVFVAGGASVAKLAIAVGGALLVYRAFVKLVRGLSDLAEARIAWNNIRPLFDAAARPRLLASPDVAAALRADPGDHQAALLEAREVSFGYGSRAEPVVKGWGLEIAAGDRLLIEGASGSGKSTLASLLAGLREADSGLLMLRGLDRQTLGADGWRGQVTTAPQFHENHVLTETFAFNALMGRGWPPAPGDIPEAEKICRELGLGELLDRMPGGLLQMVGESGWQLSHGEKSRLFIARALLQKADLVILDESFAALDPENLRLSLECVLKRAPTLMVVAHP